MWVWEIVTRREKKDLQCVYVFQTYVFIHVTWKSFKCFTHCKNTRVTLSHSSCSFNNNNNRNVNAMFNNHFNGRPTITAPQTQLIKLWLNIDWISNLVWLMLLYFNKEPFQNVSLTPRSYRIRWMESQ